MKNRVNKFRFVIILIGSLLLPAAYAQQSATDSLPVVTVDYVRSDTVVDRMPFSGTVIAREEVYVSSQLSGFQIQSIHVDVGTLVKKGDTLITVDARQLESELAQIEFDVLLAEADIRQSGSRISASETSLAMANDTLLRTIELRKSGSVSQSVLDQSRGLTDEALAALAIANENLLIANIAHSQLLEKRKLITLNLSHTIITAPRNGMITSRSAHVGAMVFPSSAPLLTLSVDNNIELNAEVLDVTMARINVGDSVQIMIAEGRSVQGSVRLISPTVDPRTRLGSVRVSLSDSTNVRVGTFAHGWVNATSYEALLVPNSAVQWSQQSDLVSVVVDGVVEKRHVVVGGAHEGHRVITQGLMEGEQVLVRAGSFFKNGDRVSIVEPPIHASRISVEASKLRRTGDVL